MKSIIQNRKECYFCKTRYDLAEHHIIHGIANRKLSEKYGLKVWLCHYHHNMGGKECVHGNAQLDYRLKQIAQKEFEKTYPNLEFIKIFGRNYEEK